MSKTDRTMLSDNALEEIFAAGRDATPAPSEALMARIMADADGEIAARAPVAPVRRPGLSLWGRIVSGLGGWPAVAGMVTATVAGIWIGFASPDQLNTLSGGLLLPDSETTVSYDLEDILPGGGGLWTLDEEG